MSAATINDAVKDYCTSPAVDDWDLRAAARELHAWADRFNEAFGLELVTPVIVVEQVRARGPAYRPGRNGMGLLHQIRVNSKRLGAPLALRLAELLRELLLERDGLRRGPGAARYYSRALREEARGLGLWLDRRGHIERVGPGRLTELLERHGVDTDVLRGPPPKEERGQSRMKKWSCGCTVIRAATAVAAQCKQCGRDFERAEAG